MDKVVSEIKKTFSDFGTDVVKEKRFVYILTDYGVLKDLGAERRILLNMIEEGYTERIFELASSPNDTSLKICSFVSEMHNKYGYQIKKLISVFNWIINGLDMPPVPFEAILRISNDKDEDIKEIFIKGKFEVKAPNSEIAGYSMPDVNIFPSQKNKRASRSQIIQQVSENLDQFDRAWNHIKEVLDKYEIKVKKYELSGSPLMFFFDIQLASTIRMTKLMYLQDEIATAIAPIGCRLIVPIPGTNHIGIEYPRNSPADVSFHDVLNEAEDKGEKLPCSIGMLPNGSALQFDLSEVNNILITGIPSSGKSNCIHSVIDSLMFRLHPSQVKFALVDFQNVEFNIYTDIANNFLADFANGNFLVNSPDHATVFFRNLTKEMEHRQSLLASAAANNLDAYNKKFMVGDLDPNKGHRFFPYIVVAIDELTDLSEVPDFPANLASIAKQGPTVGLHLIVASRSRIKRNMMSEDTRNAFNARISFKQESSIDSKAIIDSSDATSLLSKADGFYLDSSLSAPIRFSNTLHDLQTKKALVDYIRLQPSFKSPYRLQQSSIIPSSTNQASFHTDNEEDIYNAALLIVQQQKCSEVMLQKEFSFSFNQAHRIIMYLEENGIVKKERGLRVPTISSVSELDKLFS